MQIFNPSLNPFHGRGREWGVPMGYSRLDPPCALEGLALRCDGGRYY